MSEGRLPDVTDVRAFDPSTDLAAALEVLSSGGWVLHPDDPGYVLSARLGAWAGLRRGSPEEPGRVTLLVASEAAVAGLAWPDWARDLARSFWPGSVTLLLADPAGLLPAEVTGAPPRVAVRQPAHPVAASLVRAAGEPLVALQVADVDPGGESPAPGAGRRGVPGASSGAAMLARVRPWTGGQAAFPSVHLLDAGALPSAGPSTIVDCAGDHPRILREGYTPAARLRCVLPELGHA